jgi:hypothetical protein
MDKFLNACDLSNWTKRTWGKKEVASLKNDVGKTGYTYRRLNLDLHLSLCINIDSKYMKNLSIISETLTLLQEKLGKHWRFRHRYNFLDRILVAQEI